MIRNSLVCARLTPALRAGAESVVVVPGAVYRSNALGRLVYGAHYRALWTAPLSVPVLSLAQHGGGLRPLRRGGSMQTRSLRFAGADGHEYVFRSIDKDPSPGLPPDLRGTFASRVVRDLISSQHPGGALVVAGLLDATGVLHATPRIVAMPDDPLLGEFRAEFGNMLGLIEVRPTEAPNGEEGTGFAGATDVVGSEKLLERVTEHADQSVDARAYLAARLFDVFVGDWDRHADQFRWARFGDTPADRWQPIPRDRDWALAKLDGVVWALARLVYPYPEFVNFSPEYEDVLWLTWSGRLLDRRFLAELSRPAWDSVAAALRDRLSDSVITDAVDRLPPGLSAASGAALRRTLMRRRASIGDAAARWYRILADEAEVHTTDEADLVDITNLDERFTEIVVRQRLRTGAPRARVWFRRRFDADETREIRIYLHRGDDRVVTRGVASGRTRIRVVGGGGLNAFIDSTAGGRAARFSYYDANARSIVDSNAHAHLDRRAYVAPSTRRGWIDPPRDWGSRWRSLPWVSYSPETGPFLGGGPVFERYGFRQSPYAWQMSLVVGYAAGVDRWRAEYTADLRHANSGTHATILARVSGLDLLRFHGFGNETPAPRAGAFHRVDMQVLSLDPTAQIALAPHLALGIGPTMRRTVTELDSGRFITESKPFGAGTFGQVGARVGLTLDSRDIAAYATRGVFVSLQAAEYPGVWSATGPFGRLRAQASTYLRAPGRLQPVLALRIAGDRAWGTYPFFDAAFVGGASTVRGLRSERFAGDGSLYGNAEVRVFLAKVFLLLPADLGAFGLADGGRVFLSGEQSDVWHSSFGGGLWISLLGRGNTFSIAAARSREGHGIYVRSGMLF